MKCVFGEMKERTEREKMKKRGGVEAWGEHPYRLPGGSEVCGSERTYPGPKGCPVSEDLGLQFN